MEISVKNETSPDHKRVYLFEEGDKSMRDLLGGKGANLAEMTNIGLPVPPGFTITTATCNEYYANGKQLPESLMHDVKAAIAQVEKKMDRQFGGDRLPLLVSVRSSAKFSMPGMMDTVLNLGLNPTTIETLVAETGNPRFVYDAYRRFIMMFSDVAFGLPKHDFDNHIFQAYKEANGYFSDLEMTANDLKAVSNEFLAHVREHAGREFPTDPYEQLALAIEAVFRSWNNSRAITYRRTEKIPDEIGIAVIVQSMVYGNAGDDCGTGVAFTRDPSTGENAIFGEYLMNAQGEDVLIGMGTPVPISELEEQNPAVYKDFIDMSSKLEHHYKDMLDLEFTIEHGKLFMLQCRVGKRTNIAKLRIAVEMHDEGILSLHEAVFRVDANTVAHHFVPSISEGTDFKPITFGLAASPGIGSGEVVLSLELAEQRIAEGARIVYMRDEVNPDDVGVILASQGVLTTRGGKTSHAAVICRGHDIPCVAGAESITIDHKTHSFSTRDSKIQEGEQVTIDGYTGAVYKGLVPIKTNDIAEIPNLARFASMIWQVQPEDCIADRLGALWLLRDTMRLKTVPQYALPAFKQRRAKHSTRLSLPEDYRAFNQPSNAVLNTTVDTLNCDITEDDKLVVWQMIDNLSNRLCQEAGIGNHPFVMRPLIDPDTIEVGLNARLLERFGNSDSLQLVGVEFFNINHYLRNYLDWSSVQCWVLVKSDPNEGEMRWCLDFVNPRGESIIPGSYDMLGCNVILNGKKLSMRELRIFYCEMRNRDLAWNWYQQNKLSWREVQYLLSNEDKLSLLGEEKLDPLQKLGLITDALTLSPIGLSIVRPQRASERKLIVYEENHHE